MCGLYHHGSRFHYSKFDVYFYGSNKVFRCRQKKIEAVIDHELSKAPSEHNTDWFGTMPLAGILSWHNLGYYPEAKDYVLNMPMFYNLDQVESFRQMQYPAINVYHEVQDDQDGQFVAWSGDFMRSVAKGNYIITETNAQGTGWSSQWQFPPYDGQLRQNVYSHLASGSNMVSYWHWSTLHYGQETYWRGVLGHELEPNRVYNEFAATAKELQKIGKQLVNLKKENKVAILYSHDSYHALKFMPYSDKDNYPAEMVHKALYNQNIETDVIPCDKIIDFSGYKMLVIPPLYVAADSLLESIDQFVKEGGHVVMMLKSGYCNNHSAVRAMRSPGPLRKACGFYYQEYSTISDMQLKDDPFQLGKSNHIGEWYEFLIPETAKPLAFADHPFFGRWPAITENSYGKGKLTYIATYPSQELLEKVIGRAAGEAGVLPQTEYRFPIIFRTGKNSLGKTIRYVFNYSNEEKTIQYPYSDGIELLSGQKVQKKGELFLKPSDVLIVSD